MILTKGLGRVCLLLKIKYKFKISLLLILLIVFNSVCIDAAPLTDIGDNNNIAPKIDLNVSPVKKPVDIVIMTDYTGTNLTALNTQINSLKAQFDSVNVDPKFHDIGKNKIPDSILNKCGPPTNEERKIIEKHPVYSYEYMLKSKYPKSYASIVRAHHEKLDGSGYPDNLSGNQIPIHTRIITIADIYDALTSRRPYRSAYSSKEAIEIIHSEVMSNRIDKEVFRILQKILKKLTL